MERKTGYMCGYCEHYRAMTKMGNGKCCLIHKAVLDITPANKREGCVFSSKDAKAPDIEKELLDKIKRDEKLTSEDLNSNESIQYDGLESLTEDGKKWFHRKGRK